MKTQIVTRRAHKPMPRPAAMRFAAEIIIDGKRSAWSRLFADAQAAVLDAYMLLLLGHQRVQEISAGEMKTAELIIHERIYGQRVFHSRAVWMRDGFHEPLVEMKEPRRG